MIMKDRFKGWRGRCGLAALLPALFFTAAWAKTAVDHFPFGAPITVSAYGDSSPGDTTFPLSHWHLLGLFTDLSLDIQPSPQRFLFAVPPPQIGSNPPAGSPGTLGGLSSESEFVAPANETDSAEPTNYVMQTAASLPNPASGLPTPQGSFQIDFSDVEDRDFEQDRGKLKSEWKFCGIDFEEREGGDFGREVGLNIPHWTIALPCALAAVALLFGPRRRPSKVDIAANPVQSSGTENQRRKRPFFAGWRSKLGVLTLLPALALAGGWIRSFVVTDSVHFDIGTETAIRLHSAKDGLVCQRYLDPNYLGLGFSFWTMTGETHNRVMFRPRMPAEFSNPGGLPLQTFGSVSLPSPGMPPMASVGGATTVPALLNPVMEDASIEIDDRLPVGSVLDPTDQQIALAKFEGESGNQSDPPPQLLQGSIELESTSEAPSSYDLILEGGGIFLYYSPTHSSTFVVPYAYLVIPLTLLSAWLLVTRRVQLVLAT